MKSKSEKRKKEEAAGNGSANRLTSKQLEVLLLAYQFRFLTSINLATYLGQNRSNPARVRLELLARMGYLAKRFDGSYRLQHRPVEYYLTPLSRQPLLAELTRPSQREFKRLYARPNCSIRFVDRNLAVFDIYLALRKLYGLRLRVATQPQLNVEVFDYLPQPLADIFATLDARTDHTQAWLIDYFDDGTSIGIHGRRVSLYMDYKDEGGWKASGWPFPVVLIVCQTPALLKRADKRVRYLERQTYSGVDFRLIDLATLNGLASADQPDWLDPIARTKTRL